jgi:hypothetical protein
MMANISAIAEAVMRFSTCKQYCISLTAFAHSESENREGSWR